MSVFVGLDCGGSSCRVLAVDDEGAVLHQGQSGAANLASTPENRLKRNLQNAVEGCPEPDFVCGCFAGLVSEDLRRVGESYLRNLFPGAKVRAEPDYAAAFYASPEGTDICVIAGTGSLVCSLAEGRLVKSGGGGYILGDEGSGYQYGRDALMHYLKQPESASDGLRSQIEHVFDSTEEGDIISKVYKTPMPATLLARLSTALAKDAANGEPYAEASIQRHSSNLAAVVRTHVEKHLADRPQLSISLAGGVWKAAGIFRCTFEQQLTELLPGRRLSVSRVSKPPLFGAVQLAKEIMIGH